MGSSSDEQRSSGKLAGLLKNTSIRRVAWLSRLSELQCKKSSIQRGANRDRLHRRSLETLPRHVGMVSEKPKATLN